MTTKHPTWGHTKSGHAVHAHVHDHMKDESGWQRFNKRVAIGLTNKVGTMNTFWVFCVLALCSLPAVMSGFHVFASTFPVWMTKASDIALVAWIAQTFIQLVLLPALMVGQNLQNVAGDARAAKTFEDVEKVIDLLRIDTEGGLKDLADLIDSRLPAKVVGAKKVTPVRPRKGKD